MSSEPEAGGVAAWLTSHVAVTLPPDRLAAYAQTTAAASASVAAATAALAMEDEPAGYIAALARQGAVERSGGKR
jgi:hypothetical protein